MGGYPLDYLGAYKVTVAGVCVSAASECRCLPVPMADVLL